jgi:hypothetical protein
VSGVLVAVPVAVVSMPMEKMHERAQEKDQERKDAPQMHPMLRPQEVPADRDERDEDVAGGRAKETAALALVLFIHSFSPCREGPFGRR